MPQHSPNELRNMLAAVLLSMAVLLAWSYFFPKPHAAPERASVETAERRAGGGLAPTSALADKEEEADRVAFENGVMAGSFSLRGMRIDDLYLKKYKKTAGKDGDGNVRLLHPGGEQYYIESGLLPGGEGGAALPGRSAVWEVAGDKNARLTPSRPVTLAWSEGGVSVRRVVAMGADYTFSVHDVLTNGTEKTLSASLFGAMEQTVHKEAEEKQSFMAHHGALAAADGKLEELTYKDLEKAQYEERKGAAAWLGVTDTYWLTALIPQQDVRADMAMRAYRAEGGNLKVRSELVGQEASVAPGASAEFAMTIYAGAKELRVLDAVKARTGAARFDRAIDFGWVYFLSKPLLQLLEWLRIITGNFGLAIIAVTCIVRLLLFPLANKSFIGMQRLKDLQPMLKDLREKHQAEPMKLNQEVMKLYKRENVNPMTAGCLPVLAQFPVFFALYKVLLTSIEMRHAPFYGWITDLSAPDPLNVFTLFGLVPWDPPAFMHVGILPLILGATMVVQQRLSPQSGDETQMKVMRMLPYLFTFMMASFPAGLVLYWIMSNTLSIIQQTLLTRRFKAKNMPSSSS